MKTGNSLLVYSHRKVSTHLVVLFFFVMFSISSLFAERFSVSFSLLKTFNEAKNKTDIKRNKKYGYWKY